MTVVTTRPLVPEDGATAAEIFFDAVHNGTTDVYTAEQRLAWAGPAPNPNGWLQRFQDIGGYAAEIDGDMVGFMTLDATGYIDLAFVRSDVSGQGIGQTLYQKVEEHAAAAGIPKLTTEASKKARPFFARIGWRVDAEQVVVKDGISLANFKMSKVLEEKE